MSESRRAVVRTLFCDSKADTYELTLAPCGFALAREIGGAVGKHFTCLRRGHNRIYVRTGNGHEVEIHPEWDVGDGE